MTQINLLPWREQAREAKKKQFIATLAVSLGLTCILAVMLHFYFSYCVNYQQKRNTYLDEAVKTEQKKVAELTKKKKALIALDAQFQEILNLRIKSYRIISLFDELVRIIPKEITLDNFAREQHKLTFKGRSQANLPITRFMEKMAEAKNFNNPQLVQMSAEENRPEKMISFELTAELRDKS